jgi:hypothetical protein
LLKRGCFGQLSKYVSQIRIRFQAIGLGGFDQAVQVGAGGGTLLAGRKEPVFSADHKRAYCIFRRVVVDGILAVVPDELVWKHLKADMVGRMVTTGKADFKSKVVSSMRHLQNNPAKICSFYQKPSLQYSA